MSSLADITNTISWDRVSIIPILRDNDTGSSGYPRSFNLAGSGGDFSISIDDILDDYPIYDQCRGFVVRIGKASLPPVGNYRMQFDFGADFSWTYQQVRFASNSPINNAQSNDNGSVISDYRSSSGDLYFDEVVQINNVQYLDVWIYFDSENYPSFIGGLLKVHFSETSDSPSYDTVTGPDLSESNFNDSVSSSLDDISSSINDIASDFSAVSQSLEYISQSQNLIIQGIDNVILHISDQLYAFWDQLYNLIHVPTYAILQQILQAINDLDINIEVDLGEIKTAIQNQTSALLSQLTDSTVQIGSDIDDATDQVVNGYDPSGIESDNERLDQVINEYDDVESELFDDSKDYISGFDFEDGLDQYLGPLQDISGFLGGIYTTLAGLNIPIGFSLTLTIALLFIGYYRFKGGG